MTEYIHPVLTIRLRPEGRTRSKCAEFFDAAIWKNKLHGRNTEGLYRIRLNGSWFCPETLAQENCFICDFTTGMAHLAKEIVRLGLLLPDPNRPDQAFYKHGTKVRAQLKDGTIIETAPIGRPFQDPSGAWRIALVAGRWCLNNPAYVHELEIVRKD